MISEAGLHEAEIRLDPVDCRRKMAGWSLMRFALTWLLCAACTLSAAQSLPFPRTLAQWQESPVPSPSDQAAYAIWSYAANYSPLHWHVRLESSQPVVELAGSAPPPLSPTPT